MSGGDGMADTVAKLSGSARHPLVDEIARAMSSFCAKGDSVLLAVSGGRDSMALMHAMRSLTDIQPVIGHVHHGLRAASDAECELVRRTAEQQGFECDVKHLDGSSLSSPADAREARYEALAEMASSRQIRFIATAHHAQDQLESVLWAMVRGTGPTGLVGMRSRRTLATGHDLLRPMLQIDRETITDFCELEGLPWSEDPTNADVDTVRGRLRADVLPVLESMREGVARRVAQGTAVRAAAAEALNSSTVKPANREWKRDALASLSEGLRMATIHAGLRDAGGSVDGLSADSIRGVCRAVIDSKRHRRTFECGCGINVVVEASVVTIDNPANAGR